jgi:hypothetical protein
VLATDSTDGVTFSSRESTSPPELVLTLDASLPTNTPMPTNTPSPAPPPSNTPTPTNTPSPAPPPSNTPTPTPLPTTVLAEADSHVREASATSNFGTSTQLIVDGGTDPARDAYLRFTISGLTGSIQTAKLRLFNTDGSVNGPAVYTTSSNWSETGITWNNRPARTSGAIDDKGALTVNTWVEYNVTSLITGNGTYSFVLATDSTDGVTFSSRESTSPPELVLTLDASLPTNTPTMTPVPPTSTPTIT